ncbi:MAG: hypothetical protein HY324_02010 [Chlamydiia bacterium]|nr:hypothetical protein [Chlamydiia bacterium]
MRPLILNALHFRSSEQKYLEEVALHSMGEHLADPLLHIVQDTHNPDKCRLIAGKILGKYAPKSLESHLFSVIRREIDRAYFYFYHGHTIQKQVPEHDLSILRNALLTGYQSIIDFIIQLLGSAGSLEESEILSQTLRSSNRKIRAQAIESLEKTCPPRLFTLLEPLIDERAPEEKLHHYLKSGGIPLNLTQLLDRLSSSASRADQIISLAMKAQLKTPDWRSLLKTKLAGNEEIFHHFATELLESHYA